MTKFKQISMPYLGRVDKTLERTERDIRKNTFRYPE